MRLHLRDGGVGMTLTECFHHGDEQVPTDCYRICYECGHAFTRASLLIEHNRIVAQMDAIDEAERTGAPTWDKSGQWIGAAFPDALAVPETNPDFIYVCPLCTHDFCGRHEPHESVSTRRPVDPLYCGEVVPVRIQGDAVNPTKTFHIGDVLSISHGYLVSRDHIGGVYNILNHMTGDELMTHQLPLACDAVKPDLLEQHPWLKDVADPGSLSDEAACVAWVESVADQYGAWHEIESCPLSWGQHNPIADFVNQYPGKPVIGAVVPQEEP